MIKIDDKLKDLLRFLRLPGCLENWETLIARAVKEEPPYGKFLREVLEKEAAVKRERGRLLRLKMARIPELLVMESYPFSNQPKLDRKQVLEIYDSLSYLKNSNHIALIGPTGVGKSGLATAYLVQAINHGYTGRFINFADLISELYQSLADHTDKKVLQRFLNYDCLLIDELGYYQVEGKAQAGLLFRLLRSRKKSTIITSNLGFSEWESFLQNPQLTAALLEKFTANCHFINMLKCKSITPNKLFLADQKRGDQ
jgi:DNA replication protein DnaC